MILRMPFAISYPYHHTHTNSQQNQACDQETKNNLKNQPKVLQQLVERRDSVAIRAHGEREEEDDLLHPQHHLHVQRDALNEYEI